MMKKFSDVKFSAFDAIEKLINFLFKATFAIMQKNDVKDFTSTQASVYMYMRIYVCVFLNFVL